jgi:hypothetical protein
MGDRAVAATPLSNRTRFDSEESPDARLRNTERAEHFARSHVKLYHRYSLPKFSTCTEATMPIQGNMGPIMRKEDPLKAPLRSPTPQKDEKGMMILGSRMTRAQLLDYIREKRRETEEKRNIQPPPQPMTERQRAQIELEKAAGRRRVEYFAALEARRLDATSGNAVIAPAEQGADATTPPEVADEADTASHAESRQPR